jgi:hypothetical protein
MMLCSAHQSLLAGALDCMYVFVLCDNVFVSYNVLHCIFECLSAYCMLIMQVINSLPTPQVVLLQMRIPASASPAAAVGSALHLLPAHALHAVADTAAQLQWGTLAAPAFNTATTVAARTDSVVLRAVELAGDAAAGGVVMEVVGESGPSTSACTSSSADSRTASCVVTSTVCTDDMGEGGSGCGTSVSGRIMQVRLHVEACSAAAALLSLSSSPALGLKPPRSTPATDAAACTYVASQLQGWETAASQESGLSDAQEIGAATLDASAGHVVRVPKSPVVPGGTPLSPSLSAQQGRVHMVGRRVAGRGSASSVGGQGGSGGGLYGNEGGVVGSTAISATPGQVKATIRQFEESQVCGGWARGRDGTATPPASPTIQDVLACTRVWQAYQQL